MPWIEVFAAGDSLAPTAGGRTGSRGSLTLSLPLALRCSRWWRLRRDNLTFYLLEWIYFGINKLENSATTRVCFMRVIT